MKNTIIKTRNTKQVHSFGPAARLLHHTSPPAVDSDLYKNQKRPWRGIWSQLFPVLALVFLFFSAGAAKADDHGNVIGSATSIGDQTNQINGVVNTGTDEDWFRFNVTEQGRVFIYTTGSTNTHGYSYNSDGSFRAYASSGGAGSNFLFDGVLGAGTYYLRVLSESNLTGSYTLRIERPQTAELLTETSKSASIGVSGALNYYKFRVTEAGRAFIYTTGWTNTHSTIYGSDGSFYAYTSHGGAGSNFSTNLSYLRTGVYYLVVGAENSLTGSYNLELRLPETAIGLTHGVTNRSLNPAGDMDYFSFYTAAGSVKIESSGSTNTAVYLYKNDGEFVAYSSSGGSGTNFSLTRTLLEGLYYFVVEGENNVTGNYQLTLNLPGNSSGQTYHSEAISWFNHYRSIGQTDLAYAMFYYYDGMGQYHDYMDAGDEGSAVAYYFWYFSAYQYHYYLAYGYPASSAYFYNYYQALGYYYYYGMKLGDYATGGNVFNTYMGYAIDYYNYYKSFGYY